MVMPAASTPTYWTVPEVLALPDDGNRYELVYGKLLVSPSPVFRHQKVLARLYRVVADYCEAAGVGLALFAPADITWGRDDVLMQPDLFVIPKDEEHLRDWSAFRMIPLVAEVLSPSTRSHDRFDKRRVYQDRGVGCYWIVDAANAQVEVWTPEAQFPVVERERVSWLPAGAASPLVIDLAWLFAD
jgi:Uma2 family endonuclease